MSEGKRVEVDKWWVMQFSLIATIPGLTPLVNGDAWAFSSPVMCSLLAL